MRRSEIKKRPMADTTIEALESETTDYREHDGGGLYLRVKVSGGKDWQLRHKNAAGRWCWLGLGGYGKGAHQLSGAQARQKAAELVQAARAEGVPLEALKARQRAKAGKVEWGDTLAGLLEAWLATQAAKWAPDTFDRAQAMLKLHVLAQLGARPYRGIRPDEWHQHFMGMQGAGILETLTKTRGYVLNAYTFAQIQGWIEANPIHGQHKFLKPSKNKRFPFVGHDEIPQLVRDLRAHDQRRIAIGLQLLMLCACRPGELRHAQWADVDLKRGQWELRAEDKKERRAFTLPLSRQAVALLRELQALSVDGVPWLFPGRDDPLHAPISDAAFNQALNRMGYKGRQSPHGFRHLFSTTANDAGRDWRIVDSALAHKVKGTEGVYNNATYLRQRRELAQWWADEVDRLATVGAVGHAA